MFARKGVDPDLIKEANGHRSDAIIFYKRWYWFEEKVPDLLSVLLKEMVDIRFSQGRMLEKRKEDWG